MRITIAAQACILLPNKKTIYYPHLKTILFYPSAYRARKNTHDGELITSNNEIPLGESWHHGPAVLVWDHTKQNAFDIENGHNLVLHEFAHQLDQENELSDGAPLLNSRTQYLNWAHVLSHEYIELQQKIEHGTKTLLDSYGAVSPSEFFAVLTETFFETSQQLKEHKPELYGTLRNFYAIDPAI